MRVVFDPRAVADLENIHFWISKDRPETANAVLDRIRLSVERLAVYPEMGRAGAVPGAREWVVPRLPFVVVYAPDSAKGEIRIIGVFHGARDR